MKKPPDKKKPASGVIHRTRAKKQNRSYRSHQSADVQPPWPRWVAQVLRHAGKISSLRGERAKLLAFYRRYDGVLRVGGVPLVKGQS